MWLPIEYRSFHDVPRMLIAEHDGRVFLFDCPFDEMSDEYAAEFRVYELDNQPNEESWDAVTEGAAYIGSIRVEEVKFDSTRRAAIDASAFDLVKR